jgi:hypothetical protein
VRAALHAGGCSLDPKSDAEILIVLSDIVLIKSPRER